MAGIFLSYRRDDSGGYAGRLADDLKQAFAGDQVWRDIEAIEAGADFVDAIGKAIGSCSVLLALIGPRWLEAKNPAGARRLDDPNDFVRLEIATALDRGVRVIPVLVGGATMPAESALPDPLRPLARRQAHELTDKRWDYDAGQLFDAVGKLPGLSRRRPAAPEPVMSPPSKSQGMPGWAKGLIGVIAAIAVLAIIGNMMESSDPDPAVGQYVERAVQQLNQGQATPAPASAPMPAATQAAAPVQAPIQPAAAPVAAAPAIANVAGSWISPIGDRYVIQQQGEQLRVSAVDAAHQFQLVGQGLIQMRQIGMALVHQGSGITMEVHATLSDDGRVMQGTAYVPASGVTDNLVLHRQ
jgi:hypothetical protein